MVDKNCILQIFGCLMKKPDLLSYTDRFRLIPEDFKSRFEAYIFSAIYNLYKEGATSISIVDIDNYLELIPEAKATFEKNNGIEYLQDAVELAQEDNFQFYYKRFKKLNCIEDLKKMGIDTSDFYCEDLLNPKSREINERFDSLEIIDIFDLIKKKVSLLETDYSTGDATESSSIADGIDELLVELKENPDIGGELQGATFNSIVRGARRGKFYIRSSSSGTGKTRQAVGDACYLAFPIRFNPKKWKWEHKGNNKKVLFIATEQDKQEIQTLVLAYLTGINEEKIIYSDFTLEESKVIEQTKYVLNQYRDNFTVVRMSNPNIEQIRAVIRQNFITNDIECVFYDYIFSSPSLLNEFRDLRIREDVVLTMLSTALKDLAVELKIFIMSSTQTNSLEEESKGIKNQKVIRGSKGIIDKCDVACILTKVSEAEIELLNNVIEETGLIPNQVVDLYKVRRGKYTDVRVWSNVDLGTCRKVDLFITDANYKLIKGFETREFMFDENSLVGVIDSLDFLNDGVVSEKVEEKLRDDRIVPDDSVHDCAPEAKSSIFEGLL